MGAAFSSLIFALLCNTTGHSCRRKPKPLKIYEPSAGTNTSPFRMSTDHLEYHPRRVGSPVQPARNAVVVGFQVVQFTCPRFLLAVVSSSNFSSCLSRRHCATRSSFPRYHCSQLSPPYTSAASRTPRLRALGATHRKLACTLMHPYTATPITDFWGFSEHQFFQKTVVFGTGPGGALLGQSATLPGASGCHLCRTTLASGVSGWGFIQCKCVLIPHKRGVAGIFLWCVWKGTTWTRVWCFWGWAWTMVWTLLGCMFMLDR
jgi:hypothetical protein